MLGKNGAMIPLYFLVMATMVMALQLAFEALPPVAVPLGTYSMLEEASKLVDASYCITETTRIGHPYQCRVCEVPGIELVHQWFTYNADTGYVARGHHEVIVALRGTHSLADSVQDIQADLVRYPRCKNCLVHRGFYDYFQATIARINNVVVNELAAFPKLRIIGHSLGGAIAVLLGDYYRAIGVDVEVVTMGQPLLGNDRLTQWLDERLGDKYYRVCHRGDMVPVVPHGYGQFAHQIYLNCSNNIKPSPLEVVYCQDCIQRDFDLATPGRLVQNHINYFKTLGLCVWLRDRR